MKLLCCLVCFAERFTVARHEYRDFTGGLGKMQQGPVHFLLQVHELGEMFQMRRLFFHFLPQVLNRVEVWRVGRQLFDGQSIGVPVEKRLHGLTGVITRPILNDYDMLRRLRQDLEQKRGITLRVDSLVICVTL